MVVVEYNASGEFNFSIFATSHYRDFGPVILTCRKLKQYTPADSPEIAVTSEIRVKVRAGDFGGIASAAENSLSTRPGSRVKSWARKKKIKKIQISRAPSIISTAKGGR